MQDTSTECISDSLSGVRLGLPVDQNPLHLAVEAGQGLQAGIPPSGDSWRS